MEDKWKIKVYESPGGDKPVEEFLKSLDEKAQLKVSRTLDHLEEFGLEGAHPYAKKLTGTTLWEIRILGADSIRIFYVALSGKVFLLLHGFKKKSQKTHNKDIAIAQNRLTEYQSREITS